MNKPAILQRIIAVLQHDFDALQKAVDVARESATHAESKAENKYDTRGLEASYLAHGQAQRAAEIAMGLKNYQQQAERTLEVNLQIGIGALIALIDEDEQQRWFWFGADAGGLKVEYEGQNITVITVESPLGQLLNGKMEGDEVQLKLPAQPVQVFEIDILL